MSGPRKTIDDSIGLSLAGLLDVLRDRLHDRRLVVVCADEDSAVFPPRRRGERLAVLHLRLEAERLRGTRDLLRGRRLHGPPLRYAASLLPGSAHVEVGGIEDAGSVAVRHGRGPNLTVAIRVWSTSRGTIPSFP